VRRLEITGVAKRYPGGVEAIRGIDLVLNPGVTAMLGPNGAGKSTLMRIIATVTRPSAGTIHWDGIEVVRNPLPLRRVLGYLPQDAGVYPHLTAREFLRYVAALKQLNGRAASRQIEELLFSLDLEPVARQQLATLSGGTRQRVAIAQALLGDPHILIVDEPTVGLDPEQRVRLRELLAHKASERIILISTHVVSDVEQTADRIVIVGGGRVLADGPRTQVIGANGSLESAYLSMVGTR